MDEPGGCWTLDASFQAGVVSPQPEPLSHQRHDTRRVPRFTQLTHSQHLSFLSASIHLTTSFHRDTKLSLLSSIIVQSSTGRLLDFSIICSSVIPGAKARQRTRKSTESATFLGPPSEISHGLHSALCAVPAHHQCHSSRKQWPCLFHRQSTTTEPVIRLLASAPIEVDTRTRETTPREPWPSTILPATHFSFRSCTPIHPRRDSTGLDSCALQQQTSRNATVDIQSHIPSFALAVELRKSGSSASEHSRQPTTSTLSTTTAGAT